MKSYELLNILYIYTCLIIRPAKEEPLETSNSSLLTHSEALDELFVITLNSIRDTTTDAISKICDFTGKVINLFVSTSLPVSDSFPKYLALVLLKRIS